MRSHNASAKPTTNWGSPSTKLLEHAPQTGTAKSNVVCAAFSAMAKKPQIMSGAIDIDDLVAEFEHESPENTEAMAHGRQWVAETFYADRPSLAQLRLKQGWSQAELAKRAETSQSYIARLEQGKIDPQMSTARKIANALAVSIEVIDQALFTETQT